MDTDEGEWWKKKHAEDCGSLALQLHKARAEAAATAARSVQMEQALAERENLPADAPLSYVTQSRVVRVPEHVASHLFSDGSGDRSVFFLRGDLPGVAYVLSEGAYRATMNGSVNPPSGVSDDMWHVLREVVQRIPEGAFGACDSVADYVIHKCEKISMSQRACASLLDALDVHSLPCEAHAECAVCAKLAKYAPAR